MLSPQEKAHLEDRESHFLVQRPHEHLIQWERGQCLERPRGGPGLGDDDPVALQEPPDGGVTVKVIKALHHKCPGQVD